MNEVDEREERSYEDGDAWEDPGQLQTSTGLTRGVAATLAYAMGWVTGVIFLLLEKDDEYVRFHAYQSVATFGPLFVLWVILPGLLRGLVFITCFILWVVLMVKAYQGERYTLPWVGEWAEDQVSGSRDPEDLH